VTVRWARVREAVIVGEVPLSGSQCSDGCCKRIIKGRPFGVGYER
jgi:hypothetical protein